MTRATESHVLYAYAAEPAHEAGILCAELEEFMAKHDFLVAEPSVVNQPSHGPQDPDSARLRDVGLNLALPAGPLSPPWRADLSALLSFLRALNERLGSEFAIGLALPNGVSEDIAYVPDVSTYQFFEMLDPSDDRPNL